MGEKNGGLAEKAYFRPPDDPYPGFRHRPSGVGGRIFPARHRARNTAAAHFGIQPEHLQPALPALPDCGHLPHHALY